MRRLLLDTHALLWWLSDSPRLGTMARNAVLDENNEVYVSAASTLEIAIKKKIGKLVAPDNLVEIIMGEGFTPLPVTLEHGEWSGGLPTFHKDPFDRLLIAQAQIEGLEIISADSIFPKYQVRLISASD